MFTGHTIRICYDDAIRPNTNRLFGPLFGTEANTNRMFGTSLAVICNITPIEGNRDAFRARLKQSGVSIQVARVAAVNWFQSCGPDTANARRPYYLLRHVEHSQ